MKDLTPEVLLLNPSINGLLVSLPMKNNLRSELVFYDLKDWEVQPFDRSIFRPFRNSHMSRSEYLAMIERAKERMMERGIQKVVLSRKVFLPNWSNQELFELWSDWKLIFPDTYIFMFRHPQWGFWMGATPELLLKESEGKWETMALAGSKPLSDHSPWTSKEFEEHNVVKDISIGSLEIGHIEEIAFRKVKHLRTRISFQSQSDFQNVVNLIHPTPALSGFPKKESMQLINELEAYDRKLYGGYLRFSSGGMNTAVVILRSFERSGQGITAYVGGGIMPNSNPFVEWDETEWKLHAFTSPIKK
jgi:isochorismate synthase